MKDAASCEPLVRESLADQIADRLADIDELVEEVEQRRADKQEIGRLCKVMEDTEKEFLSREGVPDDGRHLHDELNPYKKRIGDLYEVAKKTVLQIEAFASSLHVPLTLCATQFPQTKDHRRAIGELGLVRDYGLTVSWSKAEEVLTAARQLLVEIHELINTKAKSAAPFPTPEGACWEDLKIRFLNDHRVQIDIEGVTQYRNYAEMGLEDGRKHTPNKLWECLRRMAVEGSIRCPNRLKDPTWAAVEKKVERLGKALREVFGIAGSPFHRYSAADGYRPRFRLSFPQFEDL